MDEVHQLLSELSKCLQTSDVEGGMTTLSRIKIALLEAPPHDPAGMTTSALELGVLLAIIAEDLDMFARNMTQLKSFYALGSESNRKMHILGLNLMFLLVENRLSEFHAELELLSENDASNSYISFPIQLERQLMVGSYDELLSATSRIPDKSFGFFMERLLQTVRDSIADCVEVSYKSMKTVDAMTMMKFESIQELMEYIEECRDDWIVDSDTICFQPPSIGSKASDIPSFKFISQSLTYATEIERII